MKLRKLVSLGLLSTLATTMVVPAFAANEITPATGDPQEYAGDALSTEISTTVNIPTISIVVPTEGAVVLNPYKLDYKFDPADATALTNQVISKTGVMQNLSAAPVDVTCVPTAVVPEGVTLVTEAPAVDTDITNLTDEKQILLKFVAKEAVDSTKADDALTSSPEEIIMLENAEDFDLTTIHKFELAKAGVTTDITSDNTTEFLAYKIDGLMSKAKTWTVDDVVTASLAWTFEIHAS